MGEIVRSCLRAVWTVQCCVTPGWVGKRKDEPRGLRHLGPLLGVLSETGRPLQGRPDEGVSIGTGQGCDREERRASCDDYHPKDL